MAADIQWGAVSNTNKSSLQILRLILPDKVSYKGYGKLYIKRALNAFLMQGLPHSGSYLGGNHGTIGI